VRPNLDKHIRLWETRNVQGSIGSRTVKPLFGVRLSQQPEHLRCARFTTNRTPISLFESCVQNLNLFFGSAVQQISLVWPNKLRRTQITLTASLERDMANVKGIKYPADDSRITSGQHVNTRKLGHPALEWVCWSVKVSKVTSTTALSFQSQPVNDWPGMPETDTTLVCFANRTDRKTVLWPRSVSARARGLSTDTLLNSLTRTGVRTTAYFSA
jgi:hypothetical protein